MQGSHPSIWEQGMRDWSIMAKCVWSKLHKCLVTAAKNGFFWVWPSFRHVLGKACVSFEVHKFTTFINFLELVRWGQVVCSNDPVASSRMQMFMDITMGRNETGRAFRNAFDSAYVSFQCGALKWRLATLATSRSGKFLVQKGCGWRIAMARCSEKADAGFSSSALCTWLHRKLLFFFGCWEAEIVVLSLGFSTLSFVFRHPETPKKSWISRTCSIWRSWQTFLDPNFYTSIRKKKGE